MIRRLAKAVLKLILPDVTEHLLRIFKLEKVLAYVELPNEADKGVLALKDEINMMKGQMKDMAKAMNEANDVIKKLKNKKIFKSLG